MPRFIYYNAVLMFFEFLLLPLGPQGANVFPCFCIAKTPDDPNCIREVCYTDAACYYDYHRSEKIWIAGCFNRSNTGDATDPVDHASFKCALLTSNGKCCYTRFCNQIPSTASTTSSNN